MKKLLISLGIIVALVLLVFIGKKYFLSGNSSLQSIYMIPPDAAVIIESDAVFDAWNAIVHSEAWEKISQIDAFAELDADLKSVDSLLSDNEWLLNAIGKRKVLISIHQYAPGKYDYLYLLNIGRAAGLRSPSTLLSSILGEDYRITERSFNEFTLYEMLDQESGEMYYFCFTNNKIVFSTNYKLVESSLLEMEKMTLGRDLDYINVSKRISGKGLFNVYLNYKQFPQYLDHLLGKQSEAVQRLKNELTYSAFSFDISDEGLISLEGYTDVNDSTASFYNSVLHGGNGTFTSKEVIPARVASLVKINFDNAEDYYQQSLKNLDPVEQESYSKTLAKLEKKLKISLNEHFLSWIDDEIILLQTQSSNLGRDNEFAAVIKAKNNKAHRENMDFVGRQIERNTPVKVKSVQYKDYTISYISFPGLLKTLFGKALGKIEKPYFTFIGEYAIFSNHPQTIKNIIDDYMAGNTLASAEGYNDFAGHFARSNSAYVYFDVPVLYANLKQFVDAQTWQDLKKNKPYITSFPHVGVQIDQEDDLLHSLIKAEYDEFIPEFKVARFDTESFLKQFKIASIEPEVPDPYKDWDNPKIIIHDLDASEATANYDGGALKFEADLKNGLKHGSYKAYYENGEVMVRGRYRNDLRDGKWKLYDEEGNLIKELEYSGGEEIIE